MPGAAGAGQQRRADHRDRVGAAGQHCAGQQDVGGPAGLAACPPRAQLHGGGQVADPACSGVAPRAQRATTARAGDRAGGQVGLDLVGHGDADHGTTSTSSGERSARCTSVVYQHPQRQGSTGVARRPARPGGRRPHPRVSTPAMVTTHRSGIGEADALVVTVASPTNRPAAAGTSSPSTTPHPLCGRHSGWRPTHGLLNRVVLGREKHPAVMVAGELLELGARLGPRAPLARRTIRLPADE